MRCALTPPSMSNFTQGLPSKEFLCDTCMDFLEQGRQLLDRITFLFWINRQHLATVVICTTAAFIPCLWGASIQTAYIGASVALPSSISYLFYEMVKSWDLYPRDYILKAQIEPHTVLNQILTRTIDQCLVPLTQTPQRSVLLTGPVGCGKTTTANALSQRAQEFGKTLYYLDTVNLQSLTNPMAVQAKLFHTLSFLEQNRDAIVFIDEFHSLPQDFQNALKQRRCENLPLLLTTTDHELRHLQNASHTHQNPLMDRFEVIEMQEMTRDDVRDLLVQKHQLDASFAQAFVEKIATLIEQSPHPKPSLSRACQKHLLKLPRPYQVRDLDQIKL